MTIHTDVAGSASRMGHRLVIAVDDWSASVEMRAKKPVAVQFRAALDSLRVESGSGGITRSRRSTDRSSCATPPRRWT